MYLITSEKQSPGMEGSFSNQDVQNAGLTPADADIKITEKGIDLSSLYSPNAILAKLQSGEVISAHGEDDKIYPASLTKIMTAILAIENTPDLDVYKRQAMSSRDIPGVPSGFRAACSVEYGTWINPALIPLYFLSARYKT